MRHLAARYRLSAHYAAHACLIFLSSFLLFQIQFIAGKYYLPYFGGSSAVWAASLCFFTAALFLGYALAYAAVRYSKPLQLWCHAALALAASALVLCSYIWQGTLFAAPVAASPYASVLATLALSVGLPYLLLASLSPLIQYWYGVSHSAEPYSLYAVSNAGSLFSLASYPFFFERFLTLATQEKLWSAALVVVAAVSLVLSVRYIRSHSPARAARASLPAWRTAALWLGLAAFPSFLLVASTTHITEVFAPIPLLWMVPLAAYLATFILAFAGYGVSRWYTFAMLLFAAATFSLLDAHPYDFVWQALSAVAFLFFTGIVAHAKLYASRPSTDSLPVFYVALALGGALGAFAGSIVAPLVFTDFWEFPLGLAAGLAIGVYLLPIDFFPRLMSERHVRLARFVFIGLVIAAAVQAVPARIDDAGVSERNFYGTTRVRFDAAVTTLMHGTTMHGFQPNDPASMRLPTSYFTQGSGVGRAMAFVKELYGKPIRVAVLGLGSGSLAVYCEPGDEFVFYEIDPRMERLARSYFSYLSQCENESVRIGDGRVLLERELAAGTNGNYDLIIMDAFSNDKAPAHLLTREAVQLYLAHLNGPDDIIAIHVSSKYLEIAPVIARIADELGLGVIVVTEYGEGELATPSQWMLLSPEPRVFTTSVFAQPGGPEPLPRGPLWTDTYTSLLPLIQMNALPTF